MSATIKTSARYQQQRLKALAAAARVFARKGFHGASTQDIAAELGIQQGSLYYYFDSKEAALEEVCLMALRDYVDGMAEIVARNQTTGDKLTATIQAHLASYLKNDEALKVHNEQRLYLPQSRRQKLKQQGSRYRQLLEEIFRQGVEHQELRANLDCHFAALSLIGLCNYWGSMLLRDTKLKLNSITEQILQLTLQGCRATEQSIH